MRTLRLSLVGTVIVTLFGGLSVAVVAQSEDEPGPATEITGTVIDYKQFGRGEFTDMGTFYQRIGEADWPMEWSDPRMPGTLHVEWSRNEYPMPGTSTDSTVFWGTFSLDGEAGSWCGPFRGVAYTDGAFDIQATLEGDGAYDGQMAILNADWTGFSGWDMRGLILEGQPPLLP